jgi:hypothetical protein
VDSFHNELRGLFAMLQGFGAARTTNAFTPRTGICIPEALLEEHVFGLLDEHQDIPYTAATSFAHLVALWRGDAIAVTGTQWLSLVGPEGSTKALGFAPAGLGHVFVLRPRYVHGSVSRKGKTHAEVYHIRRPSHSTEAPTMEVFTTVPPAACNAREWTGWWRSVWSSGRKLATWFVPGFDADNGELHFVWHVPREYKVSMSEDVLPFLRKSTTLRVKNVLYDEMPTGGDFPFLFSCHVLSSGMTCSDVGMVYSHHGRSKELRMCLLWALWKAHYHSVAWADPAFVRLDDVKDC